MMKFNETAIATKNSSKLSSELSNWIRYPSLISAPHTFYGDNQNKLRLFPYHETVLRLTSRYYTITSLYPSILHCASHPCYTPLFLLFRGWKGWRITLNFTHAYASIRGWKSRGVFYGKPRHSQAQRPGDGVNEILFFCD